MPSHGTRGVIRSAAPFIPRQALIVSATKGIEQDTFLRVSEVIAQEVRGARPIAVLSGPSFAMEVARGLPTAVSVACADPVLAEDVQREFRATYFRLYASTDVVGVEIGGALKNIIAIAAGRRRRAGSWSERARGADHAGTRRDYTSRVRGRRTPGDAGGIERPGRSGADVHGIAEPQPSCRRRAGARAQHRRRRRGNEDGGRRCENNRRGAGARKENMASSCRSPRRWPKCWRARRSAAGAVEELMLRPQKTEQEYR